MGSIHSDLPNGTEDGSGVFHFEGIEYRVDTERGSLSQGRILQKQAG
jgi:hypothetical protein